MENEYKNYKYFKGEDLCPFDAGSGKAVWWKIEKYAFEAKDVKYHNTLSETMLSYLRERVWQSDSGAPTTSWETGIKRSTDLYKKGLWSAGYICEESATIGSAY